MTPYEIAWEWIVLSYKEGTLPWTAAEASRIAVRSGRSFP